MTLLVVVTKAVPLLLCTAATSLFDADDGVTFILRFKALALLVADVEPSEVELLNRRCC